MNAVLLRKDLRENAGVFTMLGVLGLITLAVFLYAASDEGRFAALARFSAVWGFVLALVLGNRLFLQEQLSRTIELLEVLPISRATVFATKASLGAAIVVGTHAGAWATVWLVQSRSQVLDAQSALWAWSATGSAALALYAWGVLAAALGRYRFVAWMAPFVAYVTLSGGALVPSSWFPVSGLLGPAVSAATTAPQPMAMLSTWAVIAVGLGAAAGLTLASEGSVASRLARRMTAQERGALALLALGMLTLVSELSDLRPRPPMRLQDAALVTRGAVEVSTLPVKGLDAQAAQALSERVAGDVAALVDALGWADVPAVFLLPRPGFDPHLVTDADVTDHTGVAVVFAAVGYDPLNVRMTVLHELLSDATHERALIEDRHAWTDGVASWFAAPDADTRAQLWARATVAGAPDASTFRAWHASAERMGPDAANATAFALVAAVAAHGGDPLVAEVSRAALPSGRPGGVLAWQERAVEDALADAGTSYEALAAWIRDQLAARTAEPPAALHATFRAEGPPGQRSVYVAVEPQGRAAWVVYRELDPWSGGVTSRRLSRIDVLGPEVVLPGTFAAGSTVLVALEHAEGPLGVLRSDATRWVIP